MNNKLSINYAAVLQVVRESQKLSLPSWGNVQQVTYKSNLATDAVTEIDCAVEGYLRKQLLRIAPGIPFVGEEYGGDSSQETYWLVDPIDGTGLYTRGMIGCTTMIALIHGGQVIFSAIYDFVQDNLFHAVRGQGAYKNDIKISVSSRDIPQAYMGYESRIDKEENLRKYLACKSAFQTVQYLASGYEYIQIAEGKIEGKIVLDGYGKTYDFAPGTLLVEEAGGVVTNIGSESYNLNNTDHIAANPQVHLSLTDGENALFSIFKK